jgi:hypothetical protein
MYFFINKLTVGETDHQTHGGHQICSLLIGSRVLGRRPESCLVRLYSQRVSRAIDQPLESLCLLYSNHSTEDRQF